MSNNKRKSAGAKKRSGSVKGGEVVMRDNNVLTVKKKIARWKPHRVAMFKEGSDDL